MARARTHPVPCATRSAEGLLAFGLAGGLEQRVKAVCCRSPGLPLWGRVLPVLHSMTYLSVRRNASKPREILQ